jgi:hypothetical protein
MSGGHLRWEGDATALSSVAHGEQALGTVTYLRRERFLMPDGSVDDIPVVSGNAWRGLLRRTAGDLWWDAAGQPPLTLAVAHAIWSGGALAKSSGTPLTGPRLMRVRAACPPVGLFGAAGGGRILDGCVQVGKLLPVCRETAHVLPARYAEGGPLPSVWDLTQVENYSRMPLQPRAGGPACDPADGMPPARFGMETFIAGTRFHTWLTCGWASADEVAFLLEVLALYGMNPRVGGMARSGHGELRLALTLTRGQTPQPAADWRATVAAEPDLHAVLAGLD